MARRILSADSALMPLSQAPLESSVRTENRGGFLQWMQERWLRTLGLEEKQLLFDWEDRSALMSEIAYVNEARERLDEAALMIAPSMLRIVLTVKANIAEPKAQRAFLAEHVDWDLRRISELCIVADSYALLDPAHRTAGEAEIQRYGWSNALKLGYVREAAARAEIWDAARKGRQRASYRDVLEEMRRFRERKLVGPPAPAAEISERLTSARREIDILSGMSDSLSSPDGFRDALRQVASAQRELNRLKRVLQERMEVAETEAMAAEI